MDTLTSPETLLLRGTVARCPDCCGPRLLVPVDHDDYCCTVCDAAIVVLDDLLGVGSRGRRVPAVAG